MDIDFSRLFHQSSKDHARGHPPIPEDIGAWPVEWRTVYYKTYPRLAKIGLEDAPPAAGALALIRARRSRRDFGGAPITLPELSALLKYSCGTVSGGGDFVHRAQPSGGGRYPIEVYPLVIRGDAGISSGVYHYDVRDHRLDVLWAREFSDDDVDGLFTYRWVRGAAAVLLMTARFARTQDKYGERGYRYVLLEAGHIGQNVHLVAEALRLKCCALGGIRDAAVEELLEVDGISESLVYGLALGR